MIIYFKCSLEFLMVFVRVNQSFLAMGTDCLSFLANYLYFKDMSIYFDHFARLVLINIVSYNRS